MKQKIIGVWVATLFVVFQNNVGAVTLSVWDDPSEAFPDGINNLNDNDAATCVIVQKSNMQGTSHMLNFTHAITGPTMVTLEGQDLTCHMDDPEISPDCPFPTMLLIEDGSSSTTCSTDSYFCSAVNQCNFVEVTEAVSRRTCTYSCDCSAGATCEKLAFVFGEGSFLHSATSMHLCMVTVGGP